MTPTTSGEMHNDEFTPAWTKDISFQLGKALSPADDICRVGESGVLTLDSDTKKTADCTPVAASSQRARFQAAGFDSGHASWGNASNTYAVSASVAYWIGMDRVHVFEHDQWIPMVHLMLQNGETPVREEQQEESQGLGGCLALIGWLDIDGAPIATGELQGATNTGPYPRPR